jgi:hypothetical protein
MPQRAEDAEAPVVGVLDFIGVEEDAQRRGGELPVIREDVVADGGDPAEGKRVRDGCVVLAGVGDEDFVSGLIAGPLRRGIAWGDGSSRVVC